MKRIRLHDARHTWGTLMHPEHNVPVAIISAWLGSLTYDFVLPRRSGNRKRFAERRVVVGIQAFQRN
ncbi:hypothetical protein [Mycobacterium sp.]|uniref:hypothetical protein n=1 Tax=Mycobacterium sp. TaxID=1785 RepID=UPI00262F8D0E|nr:hypothetical protein [Mycobacterium sp.]